MQNIKRKVWLGLGLLVVAVFLLLFFEFYIPNLGRKTKEITYIIESGIGNREIAEDLEKQGIIKNTLFFRLYAAGSGQYGKLQAGKSVLSSDMSIATIVNVLASGDVITHTVTIIEGWNLKQIASYVEKEEFYSSKEFLAAGKRDFSQQFSFLKDKPRSLNLEGYIFPDTYKVHPEDSADVLVQKALNNFDKKLTPELRTEITRQNKSIFKIVTMASILEKEARSPEDKKVISGILWKRLKAGMALQVDSTVNFVTGKSDAKATIKDTKIDSPYNTYMYVGLPLGPISSPGIDSLLAAIYPKESPYWYYLAADGTGETIFSKTLAEHAAAIDKYFR